MSSKILVAFRIDPKQFGKIKQFIKKSKGKVESVSHFIRMAIVEKLKRK